TGPHGVRRVFPRPKDDMTANVVGRGEWELIGYRTVLGQSQTGPTCRPYSAPQPPYEFHARAAVVVGAFPRVGFRMVHGDTPVRGHRMKPLAVLAIDEVTLDVVPLLPGRGQEAFV